MAAGHGKKERILQDYSERLQRAGAHLGGLSWHERAAGAGAAAATARDRRGGDGRQEHLMRLALERPSCRSRKMPDGALGGTRSSMMTWRRGKAARASRPLDRVFRIKGAWREARSSMPGGHVANHAALTRVLLAQVLGGIRPPSAALSALAVMRVTLTVLNARAEQRRAHPARRAARTTVDGHSDCPVDDAHRFQLGRIQGDEGRAD